MGSGSDNTIRVVTGIKLIRGSFIRPRSIPAPTLVRCEIPLPCNDYSVWCDTPEMVPISCCTTTGNPEYRLTVPGTLYLGLTTETLFMTTSPGDEFHATPQHYYTIPAMDTFVLSYPSAHVVTADEPLFNSTYPLTVRESPPTDVVAINANDPSWWSDMIDFSATSIGTRGRFAFYCWYSLFYLSFVPESNPLLGANMMFVGTGPYNNNQSFCMANSELNAVGPFSNTTLYDTSTWHKNNPKWWYAKDNGDNTGFYKYICWTLAD